MAKQQSRVRLSHNPWGCLRGTAAEYNIIILVMLLTSTSCNHSRSRAM